MEVSSEMTMKLSLETLPEAAASVTKRSEGSPEYHEYPPTKDSASQPRDININITAPKAVSGIYIV